MAEFLALEWEHEHVCGVLAHVTPGRVRIDRTFVIPKPTASASSSGPLQVEWLKPQLARLGITGGEALVALPRDEAVVKRIELPEAPDDELPVLVRFQAGAKSSVALDELNLDFIPLPRRSDVPGREALLATVPRQTIDEVTTVCRISGLQAVLIGLTAAAVAELVARAESSRDDAASGASLVVGRHGNRVEISMLRRCHLLFSHSARLSEAATGQEAQAIVAEVSRALVALRGAIADVKIERAWTLVSATEHEQLAESLHRRLQCEVLSLDPFASVDRDPKVADAAADRSLFAGPIGMLLAKSDPRVPGLDFLSPRRPAVKRNIKRQQKILAGAVAAVLAFGLIGYQWMRLSRLDSEIDDKNVEETALNDKLKVYEPSDQTAGLVARWDAEGEDWLEELAELNTRMPPTDKVYLNKLRLEPRSGQAAAAVIHLDGFARDQNEVLLLNPRFLVAGDRYQGRPVKELPDSKQEYYPAAFSKIIQLMPAKPKAAPARGPATKSDAEPPSESGTRQSAESKPETRAGAGRASS